MELSEDTKYLILNILFVISIIALVTTPFIYYNVKNNEPVPNGLKAFVFLSTFFILISRPYVALSLNIARDWNVKY